MNVMNILVGLVYTIADKEKLGEKSDYAYVIEPDEPVKDEAQLINELIKWGNGADKQVDIESVSKTEMIASFDGKKYCVKLEPAKDDSFVSNWGMMTYRCIYLYEIK